MGEKKLILGASILLLLTLVACTTMQPLKGDLSKEEIANAIEPGDEINILTKSGGQHLIIVSSITEDIIIGGGKQFKIEDIERIEIKKLSGAGKAGAAVVGVGVGYLIYAIFFAVVTAFLTSGI